MICRCRTVFRGIEKIGGEENGHIKNTINTQKDKEGKYKPLIAGLCCGFSVENLRNRSKVSL